LVDDTPPRGDDELVTPSRDATQHRSSATESIGYEVDDGLDTEVDVVEPTFTVTNPPDTVSVSTFIDGRIRHVALSEGATSMTEPDLADEIVVMATLATQDARAAQYAYVLEGMSEQGHDRAAIRDFLSRDLGLPSPEEASDTRAQVFTERYAGDHE
jgi:hypothetical protein